MSRKYEVTGGGSTDKIPFETKERTQRRDACRAGKIYRRKDDRMGQKSRDSNSAE